MCLHTLTLKTNGFLSTVSHEGVTCFHTITPVTELHYCSITATAATKLVFFCSDNPGQLSLWDLETCSVLSVLSLDARVHCTKLLSGQEAYILLGLSHRPALIAVRPTSKTLIPNRHTSKDRDLFGESSSSEEEES